MNKCLDKLLPAPLLLLGLAIPPAVPAASLFDTEVWY